MSSLTGLDRFVWFECPRDESRGYFRTSLADEKQECGARCGLFVRPGDDTSFAYFIVGEFDYVPPRRRERAMVLRVTTDPCSPVEMTDSDLRTRKKLGNKIHRSKPHVLVSRIFWRLVSKRLEQTIALVLTFFILISTLYIIIQLLMEVSRKKSESSRESRKRTACVMPVSGN